MEKYAYKKQGKEKYKPSVENKSIVTLAGTTDQRVLNKGFVVPI